MSLKVKFVGGQGILRKFSSLASGSKRIDIAVAYVKPGGLDAIEPALKKLLERNNLNKCRFAIGLSAHHITHPEAVRRLLELQDSYPRIVEVRYSSRATFHPKIMLFWRDGTISAIVGSSNLTSGGVNGGNVEANILLSGRLGQVLGDIQDFIEKIMEKPLTEILTRQRYTEYRCDFENSLRKKKKLHRSALSLRQTAPVSEPPSNPDTDEGFDYGLDEIALRSEEGVFWKLSPGRNAEQWSAWKANINQSSKAGVVAVGWTRLGDPRRLTKDKLVDKAKGSKNPKPGYIAGQLITFMRKVKKRHYILVYGRKKVVGIAKVISDKCEYLGKKDLNPYGNRRRVLWLTTAEIPLTERQTRPFRYPEDTIHMIKAKDVPKKVKTALDDSKLLDKSI